MDRLAVVAGASGGIGRALTDQVLARGLADRVIGLSRTRPWDDDSERSWLPLDLQSEPSIEAAAAGIAGMGPPTLVLVAAGLLHGDGVSPEKTYRALSAEALNTLFAVNTIGPALLAKHLLPLMPRKERSVFAVLSARVGSIGDNRLGGWYGYRASKAALNMVVRSLAIEHRRTHPEAICVALHPGTLRTALSDPFVSKDAARALSPDQSAEAPLDVLSSLTPADSGGFYAWDGAAIPW
jgi:NAD(P)-dependent dehydrogenase (short-subunit alcohol dehydrogenase family)